MAYKMSDNLGVWNALCKTDPKHTKSFQRAGGFKGTAIKPIWSTKMMTEQFGPCGSGWGMTKPEFQTVSGDGEILVYCTVGLWHGKPENLVYGVGGDKVTAKRKDGGSFNSDEAFKSAYTDALSNAMKQIGVGADVHMGLFDDHKYVKEMEREFNEPASKGEPVEDRREAWVSEFIAQLREAHDLGDFKARWNHEQTAINALTDDQFKAIMMVKAEMALKFQRAGSNGNTGMIAPAKAPSRPPVALDDEIPF